MRRSRCFRMQASRSSTFTSTGSPPWPTTPRGHRPWATAGFFDYAKFGMFHLLGIYATVALLGGGGSSQASLVSWPSTPLVTVRRRRHRRRTTPVEVLTGLAWLALPLIVLVVGTSAWTVSSEILGYGALLTALTGYDVLAARAATSIGHLCGLVLTILGVGLIALIPGHELVHRTWDRTNLWIGRMLYAFAFDAPFSIEHVYGHHRYVSGTRPRHRTAWAQRVRTCGALHHRWEPERLGHRMRASQAPKAARLVTSQRMAPWPCHQREPRRGCGPAWRPCRGAVVPCLRLGGKAILEMVNYMEHYGMVRARPTRAAAPQLEHHRRSAPGRCSTHAALHHHARGESPTATSPYPDAPMMVDGYLSTMFLTMIPPVWHRLMAPRSGVGPGVRYAQRKADGLRSQPGERDGGVRRPRARRAWHRLGDGRAEPTAGHQRHTPDDARRSSGVFWFWVVGRRASASGDGGFLEEQVVVVVWHVGHFWVGSCQWVPGSTGMPSNGRDSTSMARERSSRESVPARRAGRCSTDQGRPWQGCANRAVDVEGAGTQTVGQLGENGLSKRVKTLVASR